MRVNSDHKHVKKLLKMYKAEIVKMSHDTKEDILKKTSSDPALTIQSSQNSQFTPCGFMCKIGFPENICNSR